MGLAGPSLGRELRALALSHTAPVPAWHRLRSQSQSRVQTATSHNKWSAASIKASSPGRKSMSADMFLDLPTMSAPSGEEHREAGASAQVERAGLMPAAALTVACTAVVWPCGTAHAAGVSVLRAARGRLSRASSILWAAPCTGQRTIGTRTRQCLPAVPLQCAQTAEKHAR